MTAIRIISNPLALDCTHSEKFALLKTLKWRRAILHMRKIRGSIISIMPQSRMGVKPSAVQPRNNIHPNTMLGTADGIVQGKATPSNESSFRGRLAASKKLAAHTVFR